MEKYVPTQPELVRSNQKDEDSLDQFINHCEDALSSLYGPTINLKWRKEIKVACYLCYLLLTTGTARQTLGEEYTNIILFDPQSQNVPNTAKRVGVGIIQAIIPYLSTLVKVRWANSRNPECEENATDIRDNPEEWDATPMATSELLELLVRHLPAIHLSLFYIGGVFYHFSKRLLNIKYLRSVSGRSDPWTTRLYSIVGILLFIQTSWSITKEFKNIKRRIEYERRRRKKNNSALKSSTDLHWKSSCPLCLEVKSDPTIAPCGHTFCWECIVGHTMRQNDPSCPLCRQAAPTNRLVALVNYADD